MWSTTHCYVKHMTHCYVKHDSLLCEARLTDTWSTTHCYVKHDSLLCEARLTAMWSTRLTAMWSTTHCYVKYDSLLRDKMDGGMLDRTRRRWKHLQILSDITSKEYEIWREKLKRGAARRSDVMNLPCAWRLMSAEQWLRSKESCRQECHFSFVKKCKFHQKFCLKSRISTVFRHPKMRLFQQCITVTAANLFYEVLPKQFEDFGFYFSQGKQSWILGILNSYAICLESHCELADHWSLYSTMSHGVNLWLNAFSRPQPDFAAKNAI